MEFQYSPDAHIEIHVAEDALPHHIEGAEPGQSAEELRGETREILIQNLFCQGERNSRRDVVGERVRVQVVSDSNGGEAARVEVFDEADSLVQDELVLNAGDH